MRNNNSESSVCCSCGETKKQVLNMFDLCIGGNVFTICDRCNNKLLSKSLKAECSVNERVKSSNDLNVIKKRAKNIGLKE